MQDMIFLGRIASICFVLPIAFNGAFPNYNWLFVGLKRMAPAFLDKFFVCYMLQRPLVIVIFARMGSPMYRPGRRAATSGVASHGQGRIVDSRIRRNRIEGVFQYEASDNPRFQEYRITSCGARQSRGRIYSAILGATNGGRHSQRRRGRHFIRRTTTEVARPCYRACRRIYRSAGTSNLGGDVIRFIINNL